MGIFYPLDGAIFNIPPIAVKHSFLRGLTMLAAVTQSSPRFVRRTTLSASEYRVNFRQIDNDVIKTLVSREARAVTALMATIYLSLASAPQHCWERDGVLHFVGEDCDEGHRTAWEQMRELTGVANSTLAKALEWMHGSGVIGYDARANGVGIRVFFNRATSSIRSKPAQKNLRLVPAPIHDARTPSTGTGFKEVSSKRNSESDINPRACARKEDAPNNIRAVSTSATINQVPSCAQSTPAPHQSPAPAVIAPPLVAALANQLATALRPEITIAVKRETDKTREWLLNYGVPKATRVAQRETYDLLRAHGVIASKKGSGGQVGYYETAAATSRAGRNYAAELSSFLAENSELISQAATSAAAQGPMSEACRHAAQELDELRRQVGAQPPAPDELETSLTRIEAALAEAAWAATAPPQREAMLTAARHELRDYAARVERPDFEATVQRRVLLQLREQYQLPALSTFHL